MRQVLGEDTVEGGKIPPQSVMYLNPEQINAPEGCHCGACIFFNRQTSECFLTTPPACDAEHGVCGLYLGGPSFLTDATPQKRVPKEMAGYVTQAPTHCENCEYFIKEGHGGCQNVGGHIYAKGCCNGWETNEGKEKESGESEGEEVEK